MIGIRWKRSEGLIWGAERVDCSEGGFLSQKGLSSYPGVPYRQSQV